jgi:hypothetical protein
MVRRFSGRTSGPPEQNNATRQRHQTVIPATPFDVSKDFAAIGLTTTVTHVLVVHPSRSS